MSLAAALAAETPKPRATKLDLIFAALSPEDQATLVATLRDPAFPSSAIARALTAEGHTISEAAVRDSRQRLSA